MPTNDVPRMEGGHLQYPLSASPEPLVARLLLYRAFGKQGIPAPDHGQVVDCFAAPSCKVTRLPDARGMEIVYSGTTASLVVVLYVEYGTAERADVDANVSAYRASWVSRLVP